MNDVHKDSMTPRETQRETRERMADEIVRAAERRIAAGGFSSLRARDLAEDVGCSAGFIYKLFRDLDDVIIAVSMRTFARMDGHLSVVARKPIPDEETAVERLVELSLAYLEFASADKLLWRALFAHRLPDGKPMPEDYATERGRLFTYIEEPLRILRPHLAEEERLLLARTMFSATHGMVALGIEEKLVSMDMTTLRRMLATVVRATAHGLPESAG